MDCDRRWPRTGAVHWAGCFGHAHRPQHHKLPRRAPANA